MINNETNENTTGPPSGQDMSVDEVIDAHRDKISLRRSVIALVVKIAAFALAAFIMLTFIFGVGVMNGEDMYPRIRDGDLIIYYRIEPSYEIGEIVTFSIDGERLYARIVARGGDTVDMTDDGQLVVNGSVQDEEIFFPTAKSGRKTVFPLTLENDELFVLGDNRTSAKDSRDFGAVGLDIIDGKVITLIRRRGL